jgi:hypothetical protein
MEWTLESGRSPRPDPVFILPDLLIILPAAKMSLLLRQRTASVKSAFWARVVTAWARISNPHFWSGILHLFSDRVMGLRAHARLTKMQLEHRLTACNWLTQSPFLRRKDAAIQAT